MLKHRWERWVKRRFRYQDSMQLQQHHVYVFLAPPGYVYLVLILITFIAGINYANNLILGLCFLLSSILCLSFYLAFRQLYDLQLRVHAPAVLQVGETGIFKLELSSQNSAVKRRCVAVHLQEHTQSFVLEQQYIAELPVSPIQRGQYVLPIIQLRTTFPFGLVQAWSYLYDPRPVWVAPQAVRMDELHYLKQRSLPLNRPDEFRELKAYQLGDPLNMVSWKHVAQAKGMYVKVFEATEGDDLEIDYDDFLHLEHELRLSVMMGLAQAYYAEQRPYRLRIQHTEQPLGDGALHYQDTQLILAQQP